MKKIKIDVFTSKFIFDRLIGFFLTVITLPLILIMILILVFAQGFPIFFIQERIGYKGRPFKMVKFRTMRKNVNQTNTITIEGDERITKVGAILRRYKLDELPEIWHVLLGQMSMVGPRPDVKKYAEMLQGEEKKILELRPGITGPATLKYFNEEQILAKQPDPIFYNDHVIYPDKVRINLEYYYNYSLWTDFKIIFATILCRKRYARK